MKEQLSKIQTPNQNIDRYVAEIKAGANKEYTLKGLPESWISAVEAKLATEQVQESSESVPAVVSAVDSIQGQMNPEIVTQQQKEKIKKEQEQIDVLREQLGVIQKNKSPENIEQDFEFQKLYQQMILDQFKKDFPSDFNRLYEPELSDEFELVPKNKSNIPVLASQSITNFKNTDVFELKEKALARYEAIKQPYVEKDVATRVEEIYNKAFGNLKTTDFKNTAIIAELDTLTQQVLAHDPKFRKFYEGSQKAFGNDEVTANMDALGTYFSRNGYQIAAF